MRKLSKIVLSCICIVFFTAIIGFGIWKMTDASPTANNSQHNTMEDSNGGTDSIKITMQDGRELTLMNPSMLGDLLNADNVEFWLIDSDCPEN